MIDCADRLDRYWDQVVDVVLRPDTHNRNRSMALMLRWAPKVFGDIEAAALARSARL